MAANVNQSCHARYISARAHEKRYPILFRFVFHVNWKFVNFREAAPLQEKLA